MEPFPADLKIVDAHHHLWDLRANYYPWLTDKVEKRICGEYSAIRKDYRIEDFQAAIDDLPVVASVHIEAVHDRTDPVRETAWLQKVADRPGSRGLPSGFVVFCDLADPRAPEMLDAHLQYPNVRGVRQMLHESALDSERKPDRPHKSAVWRANLQHVLKAGLSFDLQVFPEQVSEAVEIVGAHPDLPFVLCHTGAPLRQDAVGLSEWRASMRRLAELDNVSVKISGLGMFNRTWDTPAICPIVLDAIDIFGTDRAMFASNFPVDGMFSSYRRLWTAYSDITKDFSPAERRRLFSENAVRIYRLTQA